MIGAVAIYPSGEFLEEVRQMLLIIGLNNHRASEVVGW
jgi:hypothetical protein